jgi:ABC-type transport system involved in cytochrome bd biosynthesis fused ATPase/permease subunit
LKKRITSEKLVHAVSFALFVLMLTEAYLVHEDEIKASVARLKTIIENKNKTKEAEADEQPEVSEKGEQTDGQQTAEN